MTLGVDAHDHVPLVLGEVHQHPVTEDPGIVDQDVEATELVDCLRDQAARALPVADVVGVGDRHSARGADLGRDLGCRTGIGAGSVGAAPEVVDDDRRAFGSQQQRMLTPDAAPRSGDDRDAVPGTTSVGDAQRYASSVASGRVCQRNSASALPCVIRATSSSGTPSSDSATSFCVCGHGVSACG